jgi:hypothetical protein
MVPWDTMPSVRAGRDEPEQDDAEDTPKTRSYVDALLRGNLSPDQIESLRTEIARPDDVPGARGSSLPPLGGSHPPSAPAPPSWPGTRSYGPPPAPRAYTPSPDSDDQRTATRSYVPPDSDDQRTAMRSYAPAGDETDQRTSMRVYAPPEDEDDDDQRTLMRSSYVPPEDGDGGGDGLTAAHVYSTDEISGLGDLGDLGVPVVPGSSAPPPPSSQDGDAYLGSLGGLAAVPRLVRPQGRVTDLPLGVQAAFVLSRIDGESSVEDILDISGLSRLTTLRILHELVQQGLLRVGVWRG